MILSSQVYLAMLANPALHAGVSLPGHVEPDEYQGHQRQPRLRPGRQPGQDLANRRQDQAEAAQKHDYGDEARQGLRCRPNLLNRLLHLSLIPVQVVHVS
jgi:hypothetical protein